VNGAELHLAVNHLPVLGPPFAAALLAAGAAKRSPDLLKAGFWTLVVTGVAAVPVYYSGQSAADVVTTLTDSGTLEIGRHFHAAKLTLQACLIAGGIAAFLLFRNIASRKAAAFMLALALGLSGLGAWTAHLGGEIRHPEIR